MASGPQHPLDAVREEIVRSTGTLPLASGSSNWNVE